MGKCIHPNLGWPPKIKMSNKKKYFAVNFIHLIHYTCQSLFPVTTLGLDLLSCTYFNKLLFLWCLVVENNSI